MKTTNHTLIYLFDILAASFITLRYVISRHIGVNSELIPFTDMAIGACIALTVQQRIKAKKMNLKSLSIFLIIGVATYGGAAFITKSKFNNDLSQLRSAIETQHPSEVELFDSIMKNN